MFTAHMHNEKIAEELLAQSSTRNPQDAYKYSIRREKAIEPSRTLKINPFGNQTRVKQEPVHYINTHGCTNCPNNQVHREVAADFAVDHIHVDNKIQEVNNNNETQTSKLRKNVTKAVTNSDRTTYNRVPLRIKFFQNMPNGGLLPKYAVQYVKDARELLSSRPSPKNLPKIIFSEDATKTQTPTTLKMKTTQAVQTENI